MYRIILILSGVLFMMCSQENAKHLGEFTNAANIGTVTQPGEAEFDPELQTYKISASGQNMWFAQDDFFFLCKKMAGDFILTAQFEFIGPGVNDHRKIGWMVRQTLETDAAYADAVVHGGDGLTSLQYRPEKGADTKEVKAEINLPDIVQFERQGNEFIMRAAQFGDPLQETGRIELALQDSVFVGIAACSHDSTVIENFLVKNCRIEIPAPADFTPYQDYSGSRLEIIEVETGLRKVVHTSPEPLEAPNWTVDGEKLIYNSSGLLYTFDMASGEVKQLETDFAVNNNNDHVLSFDGSKLAISHHVKGKPGGGSSIFIMPASGGIPEPVTELTPSYLHGWSPDGKWLIYTAERNGQYDIYKISVNGGEEYQLTNHPALDDGSEYTPDGQWIYFNSARTGKMQIWRMKPDGTNLQQITFDEYNNWFPHVSPDGTKILFLSYPPEIDAGDHPHYKHVMLRLMDIDGSNLKTIAYLYGGQGTINVPSWSPDSKRAAFVSYSF